MLSSSQLNMNEGWKRLAKSARIQWPITNFRQLEIYKKNQKEKLTQWGALPSKEKSIPSSADDQYGNSWLYNHTLLKPCRFLTAPRLTSETTSDRVCLTKVIPQETTKCRKCKTCIETQAHVLVQCKHTKTQIIHRHDEIRNFISRKLTANTREFQVIEEAAIATPSGLVCLT